MVDILVGTSACVVTLQVAKHAWPVPLGLGRVSGWRMTTSKA